MDLIAGRTWSIERRPIRHLDPVLIFVTLALSVIGLFLIYSATHASLAAQHLDLSLYVKKQVTALTLGTILLLLVMTFDYRDFGPAGRQKCPGLGDPYTPQTCGA